MCCPLGFVNLARRFVAIGVDDANPVAANLGQVTLLEIDKFVGHREQRRYTLATKFRRHQFR